MLTWLFKIAGKEEYLASLGATPDIIQYIANQPSAQYLVNEFRKNPTLTIEQLQEIQVPEKRQPQLSSYQTDYIQTGVNFLKRRMPEKTEEFRTWLLVEFRKLQAAGRLFDQANREGRIEVFYRVPGVDELWSGFLGDLSDWIVATNPQLASYSFDQAFEASQDWHHEQTEGATEYGPQDPSLIVYGPQWRNPEWQGWTVQQVVNERDMYAEGNKMNHCVGSYCGDVGSGNIRIFSLRDPQNEPHVTIEFEGNKDNISQIQGNSNSEPKPIYKQMLKEWFSAIPDIEMSYHEGYDWNRLHYVDNREIDEEMHNIIYAGNDYGIRSDWGSFEAAEAYRSLMRIFNHNNRDYGYYSWMGDSADVLARAAHDHDKWYQEIAIGPAAIDPETGKMNWRTYKTSSQVYALEEIMTDNQNNTTDSFHMHDYGIKWPDEEDYETEQEYNEALEQAQKYEQEIIDESYVSSLPGAFDNELWKELNRLQKEDPLYIPPKHDTPERVANRNWLQLIAEN